MVGQRGAGEPGGALCVEAGGQWLTVSVHQCTSQPVDTSLLGVPALSHRIIQDMGNSILTSFASLVM